MGLVATLREIKKDAPEQLNRLSENRPMMIDGSLSEIITRALNVAHSKKDFTTGEPFYGKPNPNPDGTPPRGAGGVPNLFQPDSPLAEIIRPTLESQQQEYGPIAATAAVLAEAIDMKKEGTMRSLTEHPIMVFALPADGIVTKEMNDNIEMYGDSGAVDAKDFAFVYTDQHDTPGSDGIRVVNLNQKVSEYVDRGARVYHDMESFIADYDNLRKRR